MDKKAQLPALKQERALFKSFSSIQMITPIQITLTMEIFGQIIGLRQLLTGKFTGEKHCKGSY